MSAPGMTTPQTAMPPQMPQVQHRGLYDDGLYPFVFDPLFPIEGSPCGYGYVDLCKNSQVAIDILRTAFVKNSKAGATPRFFSRSDGSINEQELLDTSKPIVHVSGPVDEQFLRSIDVGGLPGAYLNVYDSMINELRETSGNTESATLIHDEHKVEDLDTDLEDHVADETRYLAMSRPVKPIREVPKRVILSDPLDMFKER